MERDFLEMFSHEGTTTTTTTYNNNNNNNNSSSNNNDNDDISELKNSTNEQNP